MTQRLRFWSFILACAGMVTGCAVGGRWLWTLAFFVLALAGALLLWKTQAGLGLLMFVVFQVSAVAGVLNGLSYWAMLATMVAGLAFWDLDAFYWRLSQVKACDETRLVERAHRKRLMIALSAGALLGVGGLLFELKLSLGWAILLGLVIFIGFRYGISALHANDEKPDQLSG
jgi:glucose dehydrogenase